MATRKQAKQQRSGTVALLGRPNVGKSTLLNAALQQPLAIVSPTPQTTREALLGVVHHGDAEIRLLDTPGLHKAQTELGRFMNRSAREAARDADVVVFVAEVPEPKRLREGAKAPPLSPHPKDLALLGDVASDIPCVLVLNKVDRVRDKRVLLPLLEALGKARAFAAIVPVSALKANGVTRVLDEVAPLLPEGEWKFGADDLTDRPLRFFAAEYVREQILRATHEEVPHAVAVSIDIYEETETATRVEATIHVERPGQKGILVGAGGEMMKRIGTNARLRLEELVGRKVVLKLWVRVSEGWREDPRQLAELGYARGAGTRGDR